MATTKGTSTATRSQWLLGTAMIGVSLLSGGWLLAIGPTLGDAASTRAETVSVQERNAMLEVQLAGLAEQYEGLPALQGELATLRSQIPATAELASFLEELDSQAHARGVTLLALAPGTPTQVIPGAAAAPAAATSGPASTGEVVAATPSEAATPSPDTSAPTETPIDGFVAVPVELTALGTTADVLGFLHGVQHDVTRLFLVTALNGVGQGAAEAAGARPATASGDVEMRISGYVYVLEDTATIPATQPTAPASELPAGTSRTFATS